MLVVPVQFNIDEFYVNGAHVKNGSMFLVPGMLAVTMRRSLMR